MEYWWRNNETTLNSCAFLIELWKPNYIFLLLMKIENLGKKKTIIVMWKCVKTIYKEIRMSKNTNCEHFLNFW
jgi:hypothetical protein